VDRAKLRQAAALPHVAVMFGIYFNSIDGIVLTGDEPDHAEEIAALEKALKNDATDAARYARLSDLYSKTRDKKRSEDTGQKAVELYRRQIKKEPDNARLLTELALSLDWVDDAVETEKLLRRASQLAPRDWFCKDALGQFLTSRALRSLVDYGTDPQQLFQVIASGKVDAAVLDRAQRLFEEARQCSNQAVELAPKEARPRTNRAVSRLMYGFVQAGRILLGGKDTNPWSVIFSDELLADLRTLAELRPDDPRASGMSAVAEIMAFLTQIKDQLDLEKARKLSENDTLLEVLPEKAKKCVEQRMRQLQALAEGKDRKVAACAVEILGLLYFLSQDRRAEASVRRAVELDPQRDHAWEFLAGLLAKDKRDKDCLKACLDRLKWKDNAHNRLLAAKAYEHLGDHEKVVEQVRLGLKKEPDDVTCTLALAAMLLRQDDPRALREAGSKLDAVQRGMTDSTPVLFRNDHDATRAIYLALNGEESKARDLLQAVLQRDKEHVTARAAAAALGD
jgi:tetratricopeptide (TPR) repeat protein